MSDDLEPDPDPQIPSLKQVLADFTMLKEDEGLTVGKMGEARAVMAAIGEVHPARAVQRLLDDLADIPAKQGTALSWALRTDPGTHKGEGLKARRRRSGVAESTAKDRERGAVEKLYERWMKPRSDWASAVHASMFIQLPARALVRLGSMEVLVAVFHDENMDLPVIRLDTEHRVASSDFLTVAANAERAMVVYGTAEQSWRLQMDLPPFEGDDVLVYRTHADGVPDRVLVELTDGTGVSHYEEIPGHLIPEQTSIRLPLDQLDTPCPVSWWWVDAPPDPRPRILDA